MEQETAVWIKEEETDVVDNEPGSVGHLVAAMEQETAVLIKQEEADVVHNEPGSVGHTMAAMEQVTAVWIKEEVTDLMLNEPGSVFIQDPLKIEDQSLHVKQDVELKQDADDSEQKVQVYPSRINVKEEMEDSVNQEFLGDPLRVEDPDLRIKQDPELDLDVDGIEHNVVASRSYASNSTRLLQRNERCDFTVAETVNQGVSHNELETDSEESTHFIVFREGEEEKAEQEESLSAPRFKCSLRANKCQTFICSVCQQSFTSKYGLIMHVFVHIDGVEPPKSVCKSCGEVFPSYVSLKKHLKISEAEQDSTADKEETFCCGAKCLTHLGTLKGHAIIDTKSRPHKCDICGKSFTRLFNLNRHGLIHTGIKPHMCDICGKSFITFNQLKMHALIHTGIRPHKCDICGKSFTQLRHLKQHALIHTATKPHKCDICGKSFTQLRHLKQHALIHTGTKPHKCDICGNSFTLLSSLRTHKLRHTGVRPRKCDICGKSFTQLSNLKSHALIHTETIWSPQDLCIDIHCNNPFRCDISDRS